MVPYLAEGSNLLNKKSFSLFKNSKTKRKKKKNQKRKNKQIKNKKSEMESKWILFVIDNGLNSLLVSCNYYYVLKVRDSSNNNNNNKNN